MVPECWNKIVCGPHKQNSKLAANNTILGGQQKKKTHSNLQSLI